MVRERNERIDLLRGVAAISMILGHSFITHPIDISNVFWCVWLREVIYSFHMELFFILAGWVYYCGEYKAFVRKKSRQILIPYFVFGIGSLVLHAMGGTLINGNVSFETGILKLLLYGGSYWFLYTLFMIFLIYPILERVANNKGKIILLVGCLVVCEVIELPNLFLIDRVFYYLPYFIMGNLASKACLDGIEKHRGAVFGLSLCIYLVLLGIEKSVEISDGAIIAFCRSLAFCLCMYVCCDAYIVHRLNVGGYIRRIVLDASSYSLQLYVFNGYLMTAIRILLCSVLGIANPLVIVAVIWLGNIAITLFMCKWILPKVKFIATLCGMKNQKVSCIN